MQNQESPLSREYTTLESDKLPYISRAVACAELTIPTLFRKNEDDKSGAVKTPYQGIGARGVKSLANKLLQTLLPTASGATFFRLHIDAAELDGVDEDQHPEVERELGELEIEVGKNVEFSGLRTKLHEALKLLLVTGNVVLYQGEDGTKYYNMHRYVCVRDGLGRVSRVVIKEMVDPSSFPDTWREHYNGNPDDREVELFTELRWSADRTKVHMRQEVMGTTLPTYKTYNADACPWTVLRMIAVDGEHYGRSFIEEHYGDLRTLENLTEAISVGSLAAARILFLVKANGTTDIDTLKKAMSLDFVEGNTDDVSALQLDKAADFGIAKEMIFKITKELEQAFLMHASATRNAERVTAAEVRYMAAELEQSLGGVYSVLAEEFQLPTVRIHLHRLKKAGRLKSQVLKKLKPQVTTGAEALGRNVELDKLRTFLEYLAPLGPEVIAEEINVAGYSTKLATAINLNTDGLVYTDDQKAQRQQASQMQHAQQVGVEAGAKAQAAKQ